MAQQTQKKDAAPAAAPAAKEQPKQQVGRERPDFTRLHVVPYYQCALAGVCGRVLAVAQDATPSCAGNAKEGSVCWWCLAWWQLSERFRVHSLCLQEPAAAAKPAVQVSAAQVKQLRDKSGAGMMDCKKALAECNGDVEVRAGSQGMCGGALLCCTLLGHFTSCTSSIFASTTCGNCCRTCSSGQSRVLAAY